MLWLKLSCEQCCKKNEVEDDVNDTENDSRDTEFTLQGKEFCKNLLTFSRSSLVLRENVFNDEVVAEDETEASLNDSDSEVENPDNGIRGQPTDVDDR